MIDRMMRLKMFDMFRWGKTCMPLHQKNCMFRKGKLSMKSDPEMIDIDLQRKSDIHQIQIRMNPADTKRKFHQDINQKSCMLPVSMRANFLERLQTQPWLIREWNRS